MQFRVTKLGAALLLAWGGVAPAHAQYSLDKGVPNEIRFDSHNDWGNVGLLQMPSARMARDGEIALSVSRVWPYERYTVTMQALPWLEASLRYTNVLNRLYSNNPAFSGSQTLKDRSFDVKARLLEENAYLPEIAIGIRDMAGTGLFSGEYLVASKRYYDWDFTLGMGWGNLGTRGQMRNPLRVISSYFDTRVKDVGQGGQISSSGFFRGENVSIFAGATWRTPVTGLNLKVELDGNDYRTDQPSNNVLDTRSPINIGASYEFNPWVELSVAFERGNTAMVQFVLKENIKAGGSMPKLDPPPPAVPRRLASADFARSIDQRSAQNIIATLQERDFRVDSLSVSNNGLAVDARVSQTSWQNHARAAGRAARAVAAAAPARVETIRITNTESGIATHQLSLLRKDLEDAPLARSSEAEMWRYSARELDTSPTIAASETVFANADRYPYFSWQWAPVLKQHIGGPDNPYFFQIGIGAGATVELTRHWSIMGGLGFNLYNNFQDLKLGSDSVLPHVRSDIKEYLKQGTNSISRLQTDYTFQPANDWYGKLSAGIFEEMYGGVGAELMYRPFAANWSVAGNLYRVRQRNYDQRFSFLDYQVDTGHIEFRYRWPWYGIETMISAGRYLAGDRGVTFDLSRRFEGGARVGIFATRTNVSAQDFGEGSFDKGIYVSVPIDFASLFSTRGYLGMAWRPLTRDGGQKLSVGNPLPSLLADTDRDSLANQWPEVLR